MHTGGFQRALSTFRPWVSANVSSSEVKFSYLPPKINLNVMELSWEKP